MNAASQQFTLSGYDFAQLGVAETIKKSFDALPVDTLAPMPWLHASPNVLPPTNRWFSGLVFGSASPVFPMPYSYIQTDQGFVFGLPQLSTSRHTVSGPAAADIDVNVGAVSYRVASYDLASVTIEFLNTVGRVLGRAVLAEGVPYVSYTADVAHDVALSEAFSMTYETCATTTVEGRTYGLVTTGQFSSRSVHLEAGQFVSLIALPLSGEKTARERERDIVRLARHATFPVLRTHVTAQVHDDMVQTSIRYVARENGPVAVVRMAHHGDLPVEGSGDSLGFYPTVYGQFPLVSAKLLSWETPRRDPQWFVNAESWSDDTRTALLDAVSRDLHVTPRSPEDTYFAGKAFYRDANLLQLAEQLDHPEAAAFAEGLEARFAHWFRTDEMNDEPRSFAYDDVWCGVVGRESSFGADSFNDHLLHWGYFVYTASVLVKRNPEFAAHIRPIVDALVWDIASPVERTGVPLLRSLDIFKGHSWASGTAAYDEGNSQEASAEAVSAWNAIGLWAAATDNSWLGDLATWALSLEAHSARRYWTNFDQSDPTKSSYQHSVVPLVWGAKHDYASWFSGETSAMLGILVLPMSPIADYLGGDPDRIRANIEEALGYYADYQQPYGDYLAMYSSLSGVEDAEAAWNAVLSLPEDCFDDGNSRSYALAWIGAHLV